MATLDNVSIDIAVVLGTSSMPIHQVLRLGRGAIIELDASEEDEVSILANNLPVAKGTVIVSGNKIAVEVKQLLPRTPAGVRLDRPAFCRCGSAQAAGRRPALSRHTLTVTSAPSRVGLTRVHPTCGRGGIGRRTSLRC